MNKKQLSSRIGNIDDQLVQEAAQSWNYDGRRRRRGRGLQRFAAIAAVLVLMVCSFSAGAVAFAKEIVIEIPVEQETIEIGELGLTLILPDDWKGKYALARTDNGMYFVYNPAINEAMGGNDGTVRGGMLFYIMLWDEQLTKDQVDDGGEWNFAKCEYIMTTKDGTYLLYYAGDVEFTEETMQEYRQMESEIANIRFVVDKALTSGTLDGISWSLEDGVLTLSGGGVLDNAPWKVNSREEITEVVIGDGIIDLPYSAFGNHDALTSVTIGDGLAYIPPETFIDCPKLTEVSFGKNVTFIDGGAFERCGFRELSIPDSITFINMDAFAYCTELERITIPASVTEIGENAFKGCEKLTIHAPAGSYAESYAKENGIPFTVGE